MCVCHFERCTVTKLLMNQWSAKSLSSTPYGPYDLQQAQNLPEPYCLIYKMKVKLPVGTRLNALKSSLTYGNKEFRYF